MQKYDSFNIEIMPKEAYLYRAKVSHYRSALTNATAYFWPNIYDGKKCKSLLVGLKKKILLIQLDKFINKFRHSVKWPSAVI